MMRALYAVVFSIWVALPGQLLAQDELGAQLGEKQVQTLKVGVIVTAKSGPCTGIVATTPVPIDWPEQQVKVVNEEYSPLVKNVGFRMVAGTVKQMVVEIPQIPAGEEVQAVVTLEITRHTLTPPQDPSVFVLPKKMDKLTRTYLGDSPYIESRSTKITGLKKEILAGKEGAWQQVEAIYDWVRAKVEYKDGPLKGALAALKDGYGDCEELSSLFIAICRANDIPARTVWVPGHCYPEFYLEDKEGHGFWIPCQAAGTRDFGGIAEFRPILQKGDNFRVPERPRDRQRYVAEFLTGSGGQPSVKFVRELVGAAN